MRILVGIDGSPPSRRALDHAASRARERGAELVLLTVIPREVQNSSLASMLPAGITLPPELARTFEQQARLRLDELAAEMKALGVNARTMVRAGPTVEEFVRVSAELGATEIVIGHKSYEPGHVEVGPNASAIAERANVRVTLVP